MNNSAVWLVNTKPQNKQMYWRFSPRRTCILCSCTMKISLRYHRLLIYDVKRTAKIDGMDPFKVDIFSTIVFFYLLVGNITKGSYLLEW